jgi:hypothetical protein
VAFHKINSSPCLFLRKQSFRRNGCK